MHDNDQTLYPAWGVLTPAFWRGNSPDQPVAAASGSSSTPPPAPEHRPAAADTPPPAHQTQISAINTALAEGRLTDAAALADNLERQLAAAYGDQHEYVAHIREMQAHIAHLSGDHVKATTAYLRVTSTRAHTLGLHDPLTQASACRAGATWQAISDQTEMMRLADAILPMLSDVTGESSKATRGARAHLDRRTAPEGQKRG
ncbi:hypothetical protein ACFT8W_20825 [Streptomyces hygroscopicus]|uniref:hypothetical protein n=1 Tax=Streptomyces hygroscopicus TaxID=1912 RepID=UPI003642A29D